MLVSKDIDTMNNSVVYDTYKDLYLSEKKTWREAASRHTGMGGCKKGDEMALTVTTQENANKKFDKSIAIPLDFDFFKHPVYPEDLKN